MPDDPLKNMLDHALDEVAKKNNAEKAAKQKLEEDTKASGMQLRDRIMPRLLEAQKAWGSKLKLNITDSHDKFSIGTHGTRSNPTITISASSKELASYIFVTHSPGYASVQEGAGRNRGNTAYSFNISKIDDLTDAKIDEILQALLSEALGLAPKKY